MTTTTKYFNVENLFESLSVDELLTTRKMAQLSKLLSDSMGSEYSTDWAFDSQGKTKEELTKSGYYTEDKWFSEDKVIITYDEYIENLDGWIAIATAKQLLEAGEDYIDGTLKRADYISQKILDNEFDEDEAKAAKNAIKLSFRAYDALYEFLKSAGEEERANALKEKVEKSLGNKVI